MENSKQTLHISLKLIDDNNPGEPIAKFNADYSGDPTPSSHDLFDALVHMIDDCEHASFDLRGRDADY